MTHEHTTNLGAPSCANAVCAVDEDHGDDGDVPVRLDLLVVVGQVVEDGVVVGVEDEPRHRAHLSEDVSGAGVVLDGNNGTEIRLIQPLRVFQFHHSS